MIKCTVILILVFASSIECATQKYIGTYSKPRNVKVLGDGFNLNSDNSYHYFNLTIDSYAYSYEEKGAYKIIDDKYILFYSDSIKDESNKTFRAIKNDYNNIDTFNIIIKGNDFIIKRRLKCYLKQENNKPLDVNKYNELCE